ncbi:hypothetical protein [Gymnodinialimonas ulvae]|uniref:hypothetical protein n=1 Tax=Gymnodinialimonas ulvae TaxID=3126504 RepID=UPI0030A88A6E
MSGSRFIVELDGTAPRPLEVRRADMTIIIQEKGTVQAGIWLEATKPGMTLDDRGVEGWEWPVAVNVDFGDIGRPDGQARFAPKTRPATPPIDSDGFIFCSDHTMFTELDWRFEARGGGAYRVWVTCASALHRVEAEVDATVGSVTLHRWGTEDVDLFARLVGPAWSSFRRRDRPDGAINWRLPRSMRAE